MVVSYIQYDIYLPVYVIDMFLLVVTESVRLITSTVSPQEGLV